MAEYQKRLGCTHSGCHFALAALCCGLLALGLYCTTAPVFCAGKSPSHEVLSTLVCSSFKENTNEVEGAGFIPDADWSQSPLYKNVKAYKDVDTTEEILTPLSYDDGSTHPPVLQQISLETFIQEIVEVEARHSITDKQGSVVPMSITEAYVQHTLKSLISVLFEGSKGKGRLFRKELSLANVSQAYKKCTSNMSYENLHAVLYLTSRLVQALDKEPRCEWWLTNGSGVGLWRGRLVPWEPDVDLAVTARSKRWCMNALWDDGGFVLKQMLMKCSTRKGNTLRCRKDKKKTHWSVAQRLSLSEELLAIHRKTRVDLHVFERNNQGRFVQECGEDAADRQCKVEWTERDIFPLTKYSLKGGLRANGPANLTAFMDLLFPFQPAEDQDSNIKAQLTQQRTNLQCIAAVEALGWVQDHLFVDFWENRKKHPKR
ncbi:hypothetical protein SARC_01827 [Sphaeroforma arctica JP610]|uniref:Uncharacterized protein n=1 Tax=Sphaeroforma arctica JP610 TaxID=667725 RepID=A0A0L0GAH3_9EUKA|nr:hypothetical protein SARC_01827 [Sphaeroforma arctica JP610]KNC86027.1 hypothetical protein SARC_01827 [Sphaeroforma arctica JP610]|eukprot:XP_014159929.1 hypothetical protein SARC_01827 [Sphaeroforma arctica JP610]